MDRLAPNSWEEISWFNAVPVHECHQDSVNERSSNELAKGKIVALMSELVKRFVQIFVRVQVNIV